MRHKNRRQSSGADPGGPALTAAHPLSSVVSVRTGILLASLQRSDACFAKTSISARLAFHCNLQLKVEGASSGWVLLVISAGRPVLRWCNSLGGVGAVDSGTSTRKKPALQRRGLAQWPGPGHLMRVPMRDLKTALSSPLLRLGAGHLNASMTVSFATPSVCSTCQ